MVEHWKTRSWLWLSTLLLLFLQTLTVWIQSIYKIGLTKLSPGAETFGLGFVFSPLAVLLLCPKRWHGRLLWPALLLFIASRALLPHLEVRHSALIAGVGIGSFLVLLCLLLSRPIGVPWVIAGSALGTALLTSIALRAWGGTLDVTLSPSGVAFGWVAGTGVLLLLWKESSHPEGPREQSPSVVVRSLGPMLCLWASLTIVYLVLSSPGVIGAWLGFDNLAGSILCAASLAVASGQLALGANLSRKQLLVWNLAFALCLTGGILALRTSFPPTPASPAVFIVPENAQARLLLTLMLVLSPVVLFNAQAACRALAGAAGARALAVTVTLGAALLGLVTLMSIFTNVWGYVGPVGLRFRNQFHVPFALGSLVMIAALLLPGWRTAFTRGSSSLNLIPLALIGVISLAAIAGEWRSRHSVGQADSATPRRQLTVMTYNMQQGSALSGQPNWEGQLALIKAISPDLIGLQESDTARPSNGNVSAASYFASRLNYYVYYGPNTVSGTYGTTILSRFPIKNPRTFFTFSDQDEVGTAVAEIEAGDQLIGFFNCHPSGPVPRKAQAEELVNQAKRYTTVIAVGDFNSTPQEAPYGVIAAQLRDAWQLRHPDGVGSLHPELRPRGDLRGHSSSGALAGSGDAISLPERIDHIFVSKNLRVVEAYYLPAPDSQTDHPAHWARIAWD